MPKKRRGGARGGGNRGGSGGGSSSHGGGSSSQGVGSSLQGGGSPFHDLLGGVEIIDINPYRPEDNRIVEVVYVEEHLKRQEVVPQGRIREGWLQRCVNDSIGVWGQHLPGVEAQELRGRQIPESARSYEDLAPGKGIVVVELGEAQKGLVSQVATLKASSIELVDVVSDLRKEMREALEAQKKESSEVMKRMAERDSYFQAGIDALKDENSNLYLQLEASNRRHEASDQRLEAAAAELSELRRLWRRGVELGNKVKKRVVLTAARSAEDAFGRMKGEREAWGTFFDGFNEADWERVGIQTLKVKELLADGAFEFNESIHRIPAEEVVGSIACMPLGLLRSAWEEIFFLAFRRSVSDDVFQEELEYVVHQERVLAIDHH